MTADVNDEDADLLVQQIRRYTRERLVPLEDRVADEDAIPPEAVREMRDLGLFGLSVPAEYGGLGLTPAQAMAIVVELTWAAAAFRSLIGINIGLGSQSILRDGSEAQKQEWLPRIASGEVITSFCLTEPDSGSDSAALTTQAVREGDHYVLTGTKRYITNAPLAGLFVVLARTSPERLPGNRHISAFLVPAGTPGLSIGPRDRKMGQAGAWTADVILDAARVPASALLGEEGGGFAGAMASLDRGRVNVSAVCVGQARRILHEAARYASERRQFGHPIGEFQLVQAMLADSRTELYAAECMLADVAGRLSRGERVSTEASCTKLFCSEMVGRLADRAVQIHGGAGYMRASVVERLYRDVRLFRIYEGASEIQRLIIGKAVLKDVNGR